MSSPLLTTLAVAEHNTGDTAWLLASAALVMLMAPGLALFYGGMVRSKSVLNMIMMVFGALAVVSIVWVLVGYSIAFGDDVVGGLFGDPFQYLGFKGMLEDVVSSEGGLPVTAFAIFQGLFAVITCGLVAGAIADRTRFGTWLVFAAIWTILVYAPIAHWIFDFSAGEHVGGWMANKLGALDFAGGTAVEITSGASGLAVALVLGTRIGFGREPMKPHNLTLVMLGAGLLWFGWFGFNAGSALSAGNTAAIVFVNTLMAGCTGCLAWLLVERIRDGHATSFGAASGVVAGLVAITPACGFVTPLGAMVVGAAAGLVCAVAIGWKYKFGYDDSLDVVGVHLVGGLVGTLLIGLLATAKVGSVDGLLYGGGLDQLGKQLVACLATFAYAFVVSGLLALALDRTIGFRVDEEHELSGVDLVIHAETAYDLHAATGGARPHLGGGGHLGGSS
ncbi:ammonium transporter [Nocardioides marmoriginsengisoli]|uniref:Ammonium transporter n=1 Tax=Nocardioides marmoriginsengisoli TaxID=661483 RepID=A0A3N0CP54_9ACTN|nr:ammonium transporter [Nocardioides marmoriginsengisoli]RNL65140.1 ammonium transporter [Nocardioides marmoriginsengisoli]